MNLPNRITLTRVGMIPFVVVFLLIPAALFTIDIGHAVLTGSDVIATALFLLAAATDGIDGHIARSHGLITNFGKFLDPLADKLLAAAALVALVQLGRAPAWAVIVILSREFAVTGLRLVAVEGGLVIAAGTLGKWKTRLQFVAIPALMLNNFPFSLADLPVADVLFYVATALTVISGIDYFVQNRKVFAGM
ncbi:MAG: CDP-diacylglycerol--glycerol-3-phosphate 3-phosphatidyltransferase [Firmicutes bacterium]|nr:CDP-diacylglycerol--glycerol-3-phosphate 3-phosphatidyltransferase [Bacillota bacterium]